MDKIIEKEIKKNGFGPASPNQIRAMKVLWKNLYYGWDEKNVEHDDLQFKLFLEIDTRGPINLILEKIKQEVKEWKNTFSIKSQPGKGRPENTYSKLKVIKNIWERTCKGKGFSRNRQAKIIQENLSFDLNINTINKHYLSKLLSSKRKHFSIGTKNRI